MSLLVIEVKSKAKVLRLFNVDVPILKIDATFDLSLDLCGFNGFICKNTVCNLINKFCQYTFNNVNSLDCHSIKL